MERASNGQALKFLVAQHANQRRPGPSASGHIPKRAISTSPSGVEGTPDAGSATLTGSLGPTPAETPPSAVRNFYTEGQHSFGLLTVLYKR